MNPKLPKLLLEGLLFHSHFTSASKLPLFEKTKTGKQYKNYLVPITATEQPPSLG